MPLEGHYKRVNTPLRTLTGRERKVLISGSLVTAITILALLFATGSNSQPGPAPGCIRARVAGRTGAELVQACGAEAVSTCKRARSYEDPTGETILDACSEARIRF
jgi:hypothetical protein